MSTFELSKIKSSSEARSAELERVEARKRNILVLILAHLSANGYTESCEKLQQESAISLAKVTTADNIDLQTILQEFESYYTIKFGKAPKLVRKLGGGGSSSSASTSDHSTSGRTGGSGGSSKYVSVNPIDNSLKRRGGGGGGGGRSGGEIRSSSNTLPPITKTPPSSTNIGGDKIPSKETTDTTATIVDDPMIAAIGTKKVGTKDRTSSSSVVVAPAAEQTPPISSHAHIPEERLLKPIPHFESAELRELAAIITRDIFKKNTNVTWDSIAGLEKSKRLIKEAIVFPIKFPQLFQGLLKPWKGILLYGPPGTGKTMLAKAVATECNTTFFNISASSVVSKWRGDSEKLIRVLFELARYHAPSTIFLDELESIMSHRSSEGGEHEGSRRMKTELLIQMDGLSKSDDLVFLLAASNLPWDLDLAMLRRLEKRILIDLPDSPARKSLFIQLLSENATENIDYEQLALLTNGYSGSDINLVCREAAMRPLRALFDKLDTYSFSSSHMEAISSNDGENTREEGGATFQPKPLQQVDLVEAIKCTKSSSDDGLRKRYDEWQASFGSV